MKIAIYCRISEGQSVDKQLKACTDYAVEQNHEVVGVFTDVVKGDIFNRPAFSKVLEDMSIEGILTYQVDRITRDRFEYAMLQQELKKQGKKVITVREHELDEFINSIADGFKLFEKDHRLERGEDND